MKLTLRNYFSLKADKHYLSTHQVASFAKCPAAEVARLAGKYTPPRPRAFVIGSYVDAAVTTPKKFDAFVKENAPDLFSKPTQAQIKAAYKAETEEAAPKDFDTNAYLEKHPELWLERSKLADIEHADTMIERLQKSPKAQKLTKARGQVIVTGELEGVPFKGCVDLLQIAKRRFIDLKTARDFETSWSDEVKLRVPWYETWNYWRQLAIYQELILQTFDKGQFLPVILAVSKQTPPALSCVSFEDQDRLDRELGAVKEFVPQVQKWKSGEEEAPHCGKCEYCRGVLDLDIEVAESYR